MNKKPARHLGLAAALVVSAAAGGVAQDVLRLITDQDLLRQDETAQERGLTEIGRSILLELKDGPVIQVVQPGGDEIGSQPVEIEVVFEKSSDGADPNMATLKVRYIKFISIDITNRIRPFVVENRFHVAKAEFPKGNHTVEIYLEDTRGKASSKVVEFKVL